MNDGGPAFPRDSSIYPDGSSRDEGHPGMSLREWFAGQAIVGLLASGREDPAGDLAEVARIAADSLIRELGS